MKKLHSAPSALAGLLLAGLAASAAASPASALASTAPAPSFINVIYAGETFAPDSYDVVSIGNSHEVVFALSTSATVGGAVTVRDSDGSQLCSTTVLGGSSGIALCETGSPLEQGTHLVTATTTSPAGTSSESEPLQVDVYEDGTPGDGDGGDEPVVAVPAPGGVDTGFAAPVPATPVVAVPAPGGVDAGFTAPGSSVPGVGAPVVRLGEANSWLQTLEVTTPDLGSASIVGHVKVYDESGQEVADRSWNSNGAVDLSVVVLSPHGERHAFEVEFVTPQGTSARTQVVVDRTDAGPAPVTPAVPAPGDVDAGFSPVDEPAPVAPAVPAPGDVDAGFSPVDEAGEVAQPAAPLFVYGRVDTARNVARITIGVQVIEQNAKLVFTTDDGRTKSLYISANMREYLVPLAHLGAQDLTVVHQVGDRVSAPTTIHLDAPAGS